MRRWRSRTRTATSRWASRWSARCWTARRRSPCRRSCPRLSICIVFVPVLLLTGTAQYLFTPLAMAVVFAMMASYLLSRTLVPTMVHHLLRSEVEVYQRRRTRRHGAALEPPSRRERAVRAASLPLHGPARSGRSRHRAPVLIGFVVVSLGSLLLVRLVGRDFFPDVDAGTMRLHARTPPGTRIEETEAAVRRPRAGDPRHAARRRDRHDSRQHRDSERLEQPRAGRRAEHRRDRRRDPDFAQSRAARLGARVRSPAAQAARARSSRTWCSSSSRRTSPTRF